MRTITLDVFGEKRRVTLCAPEEIEETAAKFVCISFNYGIPYEYYQRGEEWFVTPQISSDNRGRSVKEFGKTYRYDIDIDNCYAVVTIIDEITDLKEFERPVVFGKRAVYNADDELIGFNPVYVCHKDYFYQGVKDGSKQLVA